MIKFKDISTGFLNLAKSELGIANPEVEQLAIQRLEECSKCPEVSCYPEKLNLLSYCKECGCNLLAKSRSKSQCPLSKW